MPVQVHEKCLCQLEGKVEEDYILFHPHDDACFEGSKRRIMQNSQTKFFIIAIGRPERIEGIGEHDNVVYIDLGGVKYFREEMYKAFGKTFAIPPRLP